MRTYAARSLVLVLNTFAAGLPVAACNKSEPPSRAAVPVEPPPRTENADKLSDWEISAAVRRELGHDPAVEQGAVAVDTVKGVVQLTGKVSTLLAKERATRHAEVIKGVRAVSNRLQVDATKVPDHALAANVHAALLLDPAADSFAIRAKAKHGVVTLEGTVHTGQERWLAARVATGVQGVSGVDNKIQIEYGTQRSDAEIAGDVESRLRWDVLMNDGLVETSVHDGQVKLRGVVGSAAEKSRADWDAWVQGVRGVDDGALEVRWWADKKDLRKHKYVTKSSREVERALRDVLLLDPRVSEHQLAVHVTEGIATLDGRVASQRARQVAEQLAHTTTGVLGVINRIDVEPDKPVADQKLKRNATTALALNPYLAGAQVTLKVHHGKVTLTGTVDSPLEKAQAGDQVAGLEGVRELSNQLVVKKNEFVVIVDPYLEPYFLFDLPGTYPPRSVRKSDSTIAHDIETELAWSPFVDANQVHVSVHDGKATLTGAVDSWGEFAAATKDALEGGAIAVQNDLSVHAT